MALLVRRASTGFGSRLVDADLSAHAEFSAALPGAGSPAYLDESSLPVPSSAREVQVGLHTVVNPQELMARPLMPLAARSAPASLRRYRTDVGHVRVIAEQNTPV
jgi:hypothetical protein